jgi:hypothetical protein
MKFPRCCLTCEEWGVDTEFWSWWEIFKHEWLHLKTGRPWRKLR